MFDSQDFTVLVAFNAPLSVADDVRAEMYNTLDNLMEDYPVLSMLTVQMVSGNRVTEKDTVESNNLAYEVETLSSQGFNHNPLPEDFPTV